MGRASAFPYGGLQDHPNIIELKNRVRSWCKSTLDTDMSIRKPLQSWRCYMPLRHPTWRINCVRESESGLWGFVRQASSNSWAGGRSIPPKISRNCLEPMKKRLTGRASFGQDTRWDGRKRLPCRAFTKQICGWSSEERSQCLSIFMVIQLDPNISTPRVAKGRSSDVITVLCSSRCTWWSTKVNAPSSTKE